MPATDYHREQAVLEEARARLSHNQNNRSCVMLVAGNTDADANFAEMIEIGTRWAPVPMLPILRA